MSSSSTHSTGNPVLDHAGLSATLFAIAVFCAFVGLLYNSATSHHEGSEHGTGEHGAAAGESKLCEWKHDEYADDQCTGKFGADERGCDECEHLMEHGRAGCMDHYRHGG